MPSHAELTDCRNLLASARIIVLWIARIHRSDGNLGSATRLNAVADRIDAEIRDLDRLLNAPPKP